MESLQCSICGLTSFQSRDVVWPELAAEWQLNEFEKRYIDKQQGTSCCNCGANLRNIALGFAIRSFLGARLPLRHAITSGQFSNLRILDCNGAEGISAALAALPGYQAANYPECDMRRLPFEDGSFDLVVHSDTLEHIEQPILALQDCRRVLAEGGRLCFTVPIIVERMTRDRTGLAPSYHGRPGEVRDDHIVRTEFGADVWTFVHRAGFTSLAIHQVDYPSATAISAWNELPLELPVSDQATISGG